jgi:hypothetical protein
LPWLRKDCDKQEWFQGGRKVPQGREMQVLREGDSGRVEIGDVGATRRVVLPLVKLENGKGIKIKIGVIMGAVTK